MSMELLMKAWQYKGLPSTKLVALHIMDIIGDADQILEMDEQHLLERFTIGSAEFACISNAEAVEAIQDLWERGFFFVPDLWALSNSESSNKKNHWYVKRKLSSATRNAVFERDNHECKHCGSVEDLTVDHIYPESKGGTDEMTNLQTLCRRCNSIKGAALPEEVA